MACKSVFAVGGVDGFRVCVWWFGVLIFPHREACDARQWDKRGEFYVLVNGVRFPSKGNIYMSKDEQWTSPRPRRWVLELFSGSERGLRALGSR